MLTHFYRRCILICCVLFALPNLLISQNRGAALFFDGADDYVRVPDDPSLDMTTGVTVAAWIRLDAYTEWASLVTKGGIPDDGGSLTPNNYTVHQSGPSAASGEFGHLRFTSNLGLAGDSNTIIPLGEWHHVAVTFDGAAVRFYLDGRPDGVIPFAGRLQPNDDPLHIGVDLPGEDEYWHGYIDEVKLWNTPLKATHLRAAMHGHSSPLASALVGLWRCDEGSGEIVHDRSRENNDGHLFGNPTWVTPGAPNPSGIAKMAETEQSAGLFPDGFVLMSNFPNPVSANGTFGYPETEIRFRLPEPSHVVVKIFNALGAEIRTLADGQYVAGHHHVRWNGQDNNGHPVASGIYLYQLRAGSFLQVRRMNLLR